MCSNECRQFSAKKDDEQRRDHQHGHSDGEQQERELFLPPGSVLSYVIRGIERTPQGGHSPRGGPQRAKQTYSQLQSTSLRCDLVDRFCDQAGGVPWHHPRNVAIQLVLVLRVLAHDHAHERSQEQQHREERQQEVI